MTSFVGQAEAEATDNNLQVDEFYPAITSAKFLQATRNEVTLKPGEIIQHLTSAIYHVNGELQHWRKSCSATKLTDIKPSDSNYRSGAQRAHHYTSAVFCYASALVLMNYRDGSATGAGHDRADESDARANEHKASAWSHVQSVLAKPSLYAELI